MDRISFIWNGKQYSVKSTAHGKTVIVLPDRKVLAVKSWDDMTVEEVRHSFEHSSIGEIAEHMDGCLAQEE